MITISVMTCPAVLRVEFPRLDVPVIAVRIELDTARLPGWNQIDAVKLIGTPLRDFTPYFRPLADSFGPVPDLQSLTDYDNDGWPDMVGILEGAGESSSAFVQHNQGGGIFAERGYLFPVPGQFLPFGGGIIGGDYDMGFFRKWERP